MYTYCDKTLFNPRTLLFGAAVALSTLGTNSASGQTREYHSQTVAPPPSTRVDATATRSSVSSEDARRGNADVAQLIQREPDVRIRRSGGMNGPAYIAIRGSDPEGVRYSLEGVPLHGAGSTTFNVNTILPELIARLDVYRTTVPIAFGNVSTGGVVDFRLRDARRDEVWASAGYGSFNSWKASLSGTRRFDDGNLRIAASFRRTKGDFRFYNTNGTDFNRRDDNPNDVRINNDSTQGGLMLIRDARLADWRVRLMSLTDLWEGGVSGMDVAQSQHARGMRVQQNIVFNALTEIGEADRTDVSLTLSLQVRRAEFLDRHGEVGTGSQQRTDFQLLSVLAASTRTAFNERTVLSTAFDLQMEQDVPVDRIAPHYVLSSGRILPSAGIELVWNPLADLVSTSVGVRASFYHQRVDALDVPIAPAPVTNDYAITPQAGILLQALHTEENALKFAAYVSRAHRQPGFDELFGDSGGTIGNAALTPETQTALEFVGHWSLKRGAWRLDTRAQAWFHWRDNAIEYFALPTGARKPFNINGARVRGQELSVVAHHDQLTLSVQAAHLFSESLSQDRQIKGNALPWRSPWSFTADSRIRPLPNWLSQKVELIGTFRFDDHFYADERNRRIYPSRIELDVGVEFDSGVKNVPSLRIEAYNLLNRRVTTVPGRNGGVDIEVIRPISDFNGQPRAGRGFYATLFWQLDRE